ncbi:unnamed protein product [Lactuca virosa]|uniref:Glycosyltransferase n=1 Tax=Lactuca virosa TaxID=75947 RepID=A0AAU9NIQ7_9ASTR|nr:unnamed protein product [Lactuca virosa]
MTSTQNPPHFVLFPFMSKGHTIPLLHLSQLLVSRGVTLTLFTTKANRQFIADFLYRQADSISIVDLPFPNQVEGIPQGIESTDKLPSMSCFPQFATATKLMQPYFEQALEKIPHVTCIVSDGFLSWTLESANKFGIPRLSYFGMSGYSTAVTQQVAGNRLLCGPETDGDLITPQDFVMEATKAMMNSSGQIMNSFYELEPQFLDYLNGESMPKAWCVGPLSLAVTDSSPIVDRKPESEWIQWLDQKLAQGCSVLYVAFGSQAEISSKQLEAISKGLEESQVSFLWVVRKYETHVVDELHERVGERGMIVREWVDQLEILKHESVKGFVSHCGWNSVLESICSEVPILAWPMMAEQPLNTRMVVEEIKIGLRVETCDGSLKGFVTSEGLKKMVKELMEGEKGKEIRKKVKEIGEAAKEAMAEGGSSWQTLNELIDELQTVRNSKTGDFRRSAGDTTSATGYGEARFLKGSLLA